MRISGRSARSSGRHWGLLEQVRLCCRDYAVLPLLTRSTSWFLSSALHAHSKSILLSSKSLILYSNLFRQPFWCTTSTSAHTLSPLSLSCMLSSVSVSLMVSKSSPRSASAYLQD